MKMNKITPLSCALMSFFITTPFSTAHAGEFFGMVGLAGGIGADYEGSDDYEGGAIPIVELGWANNETPPASGSEIQFGFHDVQLGFPSGLNVGLIRLYRPEGLYQMHLGLNYSGGRDESDNDALKGMGDIDGSALGIMNFSYSSEDHGWDAALTLGHDLENKTKSTTLDTTVGYTFPLAKTVTLSTHAVMSFANDEHMQTYFGVSQKQANTSVHNRYDAGSGLKSSGLEMEVNWQISEHFGLSLGAEYNHLMGDAADSPLVKDYGDENGFGANIGLVYSF